MGLPPQTPRIAPLPSGYALILNKRSLRDRQTKPIAHDRYASTLSTAYDMQEVKVTLRD